MKALRGKMESAMKMAYSDLLRSLLCRVWTLRKCGNQNENPLMKAMKSLYSMLNSAVDVAGHTLLALLQWNPEWRNDTLRLFESVSCARSPLGLFSTAMDTVVGLEAMSRYLELNPKSANPTTVTVSAGQKSLKYTVNASNGGEIQSGVLKELQKNVSGTSQGKGFASVQLVERWTTSVPANNAGSRFSIGVCYRLPVSGSRSATVEVSVRDSWAASSACGLTILEVGIPSGLEVNETALSDLVTSQKSSVSVIHFEVSAQRVTFYLSYISHTKSNSFSFSAEQKFVVKGLKPSRLSRVYRYYVPTDTAEAFTKAC